MMLLELRVEFKYIAALALLLGDFLNASFDDSDISVGGSTAVIIISLTEPRHLLDEVLRLMKVRLRLLVLLLLHPQSVS